MAGQASTETNTFASHPVQYEVKNWLFGRGHVAHSSASRRNLDDGGRKKGPQEIDGKDLTKTDEKARLRPFRKSSYQGLPLEKLNQERAKLKKSDQSERLQDGLLQEDDAVESSSVDAGPNWRKRHSRHKSTASQRSTQTHRLSLHLQMLRGERTSVASSAVSGDTLVGSNVDMESSSPSSTCMRFSAGSFSKFEPDPSSPSLACAHLSAASVPTPLTSSSPKSLASTNSATTTSHFHQTETPLDHHITHSISSSTSLASAKPIMDEQSRIHKAFSAFRQSTSKAKKEDHRRIKKETDDVDTNYRLKPQRSLILIGRKRDQGWNGAHGNITQSPRTPPRSPSYHPHHYASMHNASSISSATPDTFLGHNPSHSEYPQSQASYSNGSVNPQLMHDLENADDDAEEPNPALLGSFDYHDFLCGSSNRRTSLATSQTAPDQPGSSSTYYGNSMKVNDIAHRITRNAIKSRSTSFQGTPAPATTPEQEHQQIRKVKQPLPLLQRRAERLQAQFADTGLVITLPPHRSSLEALRSQGPESLLETRVQRLADLYAWENTSKPSQHKHASSLLKYSFTTPDTTAATALSNTNLPSPVGGSTFPSRSASQPCLPPTSRQAPFPSVLVNSPSSCGRSTIRSQMHQTSRSPGDPATILAPLGSFHRESSVLGPAGSISYTEIDSEKITPFIGPLTKQQPPPTGPLPNPPVAQMRRFQAPNSTNTEAQENNNYASKSASRMLYESVTPAKESLQSVNSKTRKVNRIDSNIETKVRQSSVKDRRTLLRRKVSTLFGEEKNSPAMSRVEDANHSTASIATYRPISMNSLDTDENSFFDIFDDVFNAARDSASEAQQSAGHSSNSGRRSLSALSEEGLLVDTAPRVRIPSRPAIQPASRDEIAERLAARLGITDSASRLAIFEAFAEVGHTAPPLTNHPAIRGDLLLQADLGMIAEPTHGEDLAGSRSRSVQGKEIATPMATHVVAPMATAGLHVLPLNVRRQRPTQVAISTRPASRSIAATVEPLTGFTTRSLVAAPAGIKAHDDLDPLPTFDRSVDMTWYRYARDAGRGVRESSLPDLPAMYDALSTVFMAKFSRGRRSKSTADNQLRRFAYFELDGPIRFKIMENLLKDYLPGKPVLLNNSRQAAPAWSGDAFATLWEVLGPLQNVMRACPRLRADLMTALLMKQPFHVIFSPFVDPITQPLPTKWLFKHLYFMQDVRVELDMTKLGFGSSWQATALSTRLWDTGNLVHVFVEEVLKREPRTNPMGQLTIQCRRFFGYRQGENPHRGDVAFYSALADEDDEQKPATHPAGQPWNYGRKPPSFPPSANSPYSGHRRHHTGGPERVPFLHEGHMSVADPFHKLTGHVYSVRMVGMSEKWSMEFLNYWPRSERDKIRKEDLGLYIDRYTPSRHSYAAPDHAIFFDYGIRAGVHRFPPLPDSEPMVCSVYDQDNDVFLEVGSGNILTVKENGVEIVARSSNPPVPRSDLPIRGSSPVSLHGITVLRPSRIPGPVGASISPTMEALRKGTPQKALRLLGIEDGVESMVTPSASPMLLSDGDDDLETPTALRISSAATTGRWY